MNTFSLTIASPEGVLFKGPAWQVASRHTGGSFACRALHAPMICTLPQGTIEVATTPEDRITISILSATMQFLDNECVIVVRVPPAP